MNHKIHKKTQKKEFRLEDARKEHSNWNLLYVHLRREAFSGELPTKYIRVKRKLRQKYIPDFICYDKIILELKAVKEVTNEHRAQVLNYLKATGMKLGLLVNFGHYPKVYVKRIAL